MTRVLVVGGTGFVGSAITARLRFLGMDVHSFAAPRIRTETRTATSLLEEAHAHSGLAERLISVFNKSDIVVNAAGVASATSNDQSALHGGNALLPAVLALTAQRCGTSRFIHISSAAVQGRTSVLTEEALFKPTSPYVRSKVLAEEALLLRDSQQTVILRPTSVHGPGRSITRTLIRIACSPVATVAAPGTRHTPQVHVAQVAQAVAVLCDTRLQPPKILLQPSEGFTTAGFLEMLSSKTPHLLSHRASRLIINSGYALSRLSPTLWAQARRLEMLLMGQDQVHGWLAALDPSLTSPHKEWQSIAMNGSDSGHVT